MPATRWSRSLKLSLSLFSFIGITLWIAPWHPEHISPSRALPRFTNGGEVSIPASPLLVPSESARQLETIDSATAPTHLVKGNPEFHLLLTNAKSSPELCRSLLSAAVLDYPPPILINYDANLVEAEEDEAQQPAPTAEADLVSVHKFLRSQGSGISDDDVVLVADGRSTLFQLPSSVMLRRLQSTRLSSGARSAPQYGSSGRVLRSQRPRLDQAVFLSATDDCPLESSNASRSACNAPARPPVRGGDADRQGLRYPDAGAALGRATEVARLYAAAAERTRNLSSAQAGELARDTMTKLFAEQEDSRRDRAGTTMSSLRAAWKTVAKHNPFSGAAAADFGMALDYGSSLFMTTTGLTSGSADSQASMRHMSLDGVIAHGGEPHKAKLPADLKSALPPFENVPLPSEDGEGPPTRILSINEELDNLPRELGWGDVALATNPRTDAVPAALHLAATVTAAEADALWRALWYQPHARAMFRNALRRWEGRDALVKASLGGDRLLSERGGHGGAWTERGTWLSFEDVCDGYSDEVFGDGRGDWGWEEGKRPYCNVNWELVSGEGDCLELAAEASARGLDAQQLRRFREGRLD